MNTESFWGKRWERSTTRQFLGWLSSWRIVRRTLIGAVSIVTLTALFYAVVNWRGSRAWEAHVRELQSRGESVEVTALAPAPVAGPDNLGAAAFFRPLFDATETEAGLQWNDPQGKKRLEGFKIPSRRGRGNPPTCTLGSLQYDCWTDFGACLDFYLDQEEAVPELTGESAAARLLDYLRKYEADLRDLTETARQHSACRFPVNYDAEMPFAVLLPHLAPVKGVASVLSLRAIARLELGQGEEAFQDLELSLRLSDGIADEPILISHLVRLVTLSINLQVVREGMLRGAWTEPQLAVLQSRLGGIDLLTEARHAFRGERACAVGSVDYVRRLGWWGSANELGSAIGSSDPGVERLLQLLPDGWFYANMLKMSELHEQYTLGAIDAEAHRIDPAVAAAMNPVVENMPLRPSTLFVKMLMPALSRAAVRTAQSQVHLDAARVACALERRRLAGQESPESLRALVPEFLEGVPTDVIDGAPLRYRPGEDGAYLLYGVGWNQQDDSGVLGWDGEGPKAKLDIGKGDWVWRMGR